MNRAEGLAQRLRASGHKLTRARARLISTLQKAPRALTRREIFEALHQEEIDQASVYRNIELLKELGLLHCWENGRYSLCEHTGHTGEGHSHLHVLVHCHECGRTSEQASAPEELRPLMERVLETNPGFKKLGSVTLSGTCANCHG